ncbi:tigger transposable element-derived protein 4-like [Melanaphis sacchari]|uniref:tigger transposable element-derived protein 4-like n=1 Tax=Melanaphis sacchari TaxID=742174 RepID=UPI000DC14A57|nr:tigger transposable element-derived protein 4-like [Melanaphis sacchari]
MSNKRRRCFSIAEKVKIIEKLENGVSNKVLCQELEISQSTLSTIWKSKDQIKNIFLKDVTSNKRIKSSQHKDVKQALLEWFKIQRSKNIPINDPILQEKATEFGKHFHKTDFQCSSSWITRFRQRHNIVFGKISGESASVPVGVSENWLEQVWSGLCKNYIVSNIYNADETGLFFRLTPSQTLRFKGETCSGGKLSKDRLKVLVASNMDGSDKKKLLVVGKSKTPRCFKNVKNFTVDYKNNKKAWMTGEIFSNWLKEWDKQLAEEKWHILLTVDNCPAHPSVQNLDFIKLVFLPPNTKSILQPMDQVYNETKTISDESDFFPRENFQHFVEADDALWTNAEPNEEEIVSSILNASEDENENDDEAEEIVNKAPSISEVYFSINQL